MKIHLLKATHPSLAAFAVLFFGLVPAGHLSAALVAIDWLEAVASSSGSNLNDDLGGSLATIDLSIVTGVADLEDFGSSRIDNDHWTTDPGFEDSANGDATLPLITNRVFPQNGEVEMSVEITLAPNRSVLYLAVGEINPAARPRITVTGLGVGDFAVLWSASSWDSGFGLNDGTLTWDESGRTLSPDVSSNQSEMAFLRLNLQTSKNIKVNYQTSSSSPLGDRIVMAVGVVIPEPTRATLLVLSLLFVMARRRQGLPV